MMPLANPSAQPSPDWYEIKGRLFRFFGTQQGWSRWQNTQGDYPDAWICGQTRDRDQPLARAARVAAILKDPRLIPSRSIPERHAFADVTSGGWNRLFLGVFTYVNGPALLDDMVTVAGVMLKLPGAAQLSTGSPVAFPEPSAEHITYEQMDAMVENSLEASSRDLIAGHASECSFCARQLAAYQAAAAQVSAPIQRPKIISE